MKTVSSLAAMGAMMLALSCVEPNRENMAVELVSRLAAGNFEGARVGFDPTMERALSAGALGDVWSGLETQYGAYVGTGTPRHESAPEYEIWFVPCTFGSVDFEFRVVFNRAGKVAGLFVQPAAPPAASLPAGVSELPLDVINEGFTLPGTLCLPQGAGPFPAVVLVHGSGPNDRDETIGPNTPFRDLAHGLARAGVASLRYDKRTKVYGAGAFTEPMTVMEETVDDAVAAVGLLRARPGLDPDAVFVLGHSLGGYLLPRIASIAGARGYVGLAAPVTPLPRLVVAQYEYLSRIDGEVSAEEAAAIAAARASAELALSPELEPSTSASALPLGIEASYWMDLRDYRPDSMAASLGVPFLFLQGGRDYQVPPAELEAWRSALGPKAEYRLYPALNHLFIPGEGPSSGAEYLKPGSVDPLVVSDIAAWIESLR